MRTNTGPSSESAGLSGEQSGRPLKRGQQQLIKQAWDKRRREQRLISCSPRQVRDVMAAEVFVEYRRAAHEAFVIEIPLLCTDAVGPNDSVGRCARARGHVHTTGTNLGPDAGWDFLQPGHRQQALRRLQHERPYFVTLAIPAEPWMFSSVALSSRDRHQQQLQALTTSTRFALRIARLQLGGGETLRDRTPAGLYLLAPPWCSNSHFGSSLSRLFN